MKYCLFIGILLAISSAHAQFGIIRGNIANSSIITDSIKLVLNPTNLVSFTDKSGRFEFRDIPFGKYDLEINHSKFGLRFIEINLKKSELILDTITLELTKTTEVVMIRRERKRLTSVEKMKKSKVQLNVIDKETLEQLNNKSAADFASRMPSVMLFRARGEGNSVSLRGTPNDWTSLLIDGDRLPVACEDNTTRSFEFEAFPSIFVDELHEYRSIVSEFESDNIGGSLNFLSPKPQFKRIVNLDCALGMNLKGNKPLGEFRGFYNGFTQNKKLAYFMNGTYYGRTYASDATKTLFGSNLNFGINRHELRKYEGFRATFGGQFGLDYVPNARLKFSLSGFLGRMDDDKQMNKISFNWYEDNGQRVRLQNSAGLLVRQILGGVFQADLTPSKKIKGRFRIASYQNLFDNRKRPFVKSDPRNGYVFYEFQSPQIQFNDFSNVTLFGEALSNPNDPDFITLKLVGPDNPYGTGDPAGIVYPDFQPTLTAQSFEFAQAYSELNFTKESDPIVASSDWDLILTSDLSLKIGAKFRAKNGERSLSKHLWIQDFSSGTAQTIMLSDFQIEPFLGSQAFMTPQLNSLYQIFDYGMLSNDAVNSFFNQTEGKLREYYMNEQNFDYYEWVGSNYRYAERQIAGYAQLDYSKNKFGMVAGLRWEKTILDQTSDTLTSEIDFDSTTNTYYNLPRTCSIHRVYDAFLPTINLTYRFNDRIQLKTSISRSLHRPNFEQSKPGHAVIRYNELEFTFGNPNIKPSFSTNFDVSISKYIGKNGLFSGGVYYKYIENFIYSMSAYKSDVMSGLTMRQYGNAPSAWVGGIELLYNQSFDFLPKGWKNLGIRSNITFSTSRMNVPGRINQVLTKQTPLLYNINLYYEGERLTVNVALLYTGKYLNDLNLTYYNGQLLHPSSAFDTYMNETYQLEATAGYQWDQKWELEAQISNLLNTPESKYLGESWRTMYTEYYGMRCQLAVKYSL